MSGPIAESESPQPRCDITMWNRGASLSAEIDKLIRRGARPPIRVTLARGGVVECIHFVHAVLVTADGMVNTSWGDHRLLTIARSTLKPIAAIPFVTCGAVERLNISSEWIALACASHDGNTAHVRQFKKWLSALGCNENVLSCGPRAPLAADAAEALVRAKKTPCKLHSDCSGEHLGFLSTAIAMGEPIEGYANVDHPVQRRVRCVVSELAGVEQSELITVPDGCSAPSFAVPLHALATVGARFVNAARKSSPVASAARRILSHCARHRLLFSNFERLDEAQVPNRDDTDIVFIKTGADGVGISGWRHDDRKTYGLAIKVEDGAPRARNAALASLLVTLGAARRNRAERLRRLERQPLLDSSGRHVGQLAVEIP